jgi:hypothetical protein
MICVIQNLDTKKYVGFGGYVSNLAAAKGFSSQLEAEKEGLCSNEEVFPIDHIIQVVR